MLTKAQRKFMGEALAGVFYSEGVLRGGELVMARRLRDRGLMVYDTFERKGSMGLHWGYQLTDAGRAALASE